MLVSLLSPRPSAPLNCSHHIVKCPIFLCNLAADRKVGSEGIFLLTVVVARYHTSPPQLQEHAIHACLTQPGHTDV